MPAPRFGQEHGMEQAQPHQASHRFGRRHQPRLVVNQRIQYQTGGTERQIIINGLGQQNNTLWNYGN